MLSAVIVSLAMLASINCQTIVTRSQWGARAPTSISYMTTPVSRVFIHHGAGPSTACTTQTACGNNWKGYQNYHMDSNGWSDIGYNWGVGEDGRIYEGRGWNRVGAHTVNYNSNSVALCFIGDFTSRSPAQVALDAAQQMIAKGVRDGWITAAYTLGGHRNVAATSCPGDRLYSIIRTWPRFGY